MSTTCLVAQLRRRYWLTRFELSQPVDQIAPSFHRRLVDSLRGSSLSGPRDFESYAVRSEPWVFARGL